MNRTHQLTEAAGRVVLLRTGNAMLELFEYATPAPRKRPDDPLAVPRTPAD